VQKTQIKITSNNAVVLSEADPYIHVGIGFAPLLSGIKKQKYALSPLNLKVTDE